MSVYVHDSAYHSRRAVAFLAIIVVHVFAIWAFASGLAKRAVQFVTAPLQTDIIQVEKPKDLPPPPPPVDLKERPPVQVVVPDINISVPVEAPPPPITNITTQPVAPPPKPVVTVPGTPIVAQFPSTDDYYPDASRRANEEGRPIIHYCVGANNKMESVQIATSSGFPRLDDAAVSLVKAARGIKAASSEGKPVASCKDVAVKFQLKAAR